MTKIQDKCLSFPNISQRSLPLGSVWLKNFEFEFFENKA